jgi:hypothetical protein
MANYHKQQPEGWPLRVGGVLELTGRCCVTRRAYPFFVVAHVSALLWLSWLSLSCVLPGLDPGVWFMWADTLDGAAVNGKVGRWSHSIATTQIKRAVSWNRSCRR